jgi:predicted transcriptional regulator
MYKSNLRVDQGNIVKGMDLMLDDDEIEEYKKTEMPIAEGIALSINRLLEDKELQQKVEAEQAKLQAKLKAYEAKIGEKIAA